MKSKVKREQYYLDLKTGALELTAASKKLSVSARESELTTEVVRFKRQLAEQAEELEIIKKATYFAKNQK